VLIAELPRRHGPRPGFAASVRADMGGAEWRDVLAAVDVAVRARHRRPQHDWASRLEPGWLLDGLGGHPERPLPSRCVGAGVTDWSMICLTSGTLRRSRRTGRRLAWTAASTPTFRRTSPLVHAAAITTPLLILQGQH